MLYTIKQDPTDQIIEKDLDISDQVMLIHIPKDKNKIEFLVEWISHIKKMEFEIMYIHFYSSDYVYTIGIKEKRD